LNRAACTIISPNYLAYARTLAASYLQHHPTHRFFVLIVADLHDATPFQANANFRAVSFYDIGLATPRAEAMKFDILELNTNVKPTFLKHLIARHNVDQLLYLDPDIFVYAPLAPVFEALDRGASAVLTPHITAPVFDGRSPSEQDLLYNGTYNLGFIAVQRSASTAVLDWWERRCLDLGFSEGRTGLFVDQKWMNLAPGLFPHVAILRNPGLNMAYWNLHERRLSSTPAKEIAPANESIATKENAPGKEDVPAKEAAPEKEIVILSGAKDLLLAASSTTAYTVTTTTSQSAPLRFFHFSGIVPSDPAILSKHTNRFTLSERPDLQPLFAAYKSAVLSQKDPKLESIPYGFDNFSDGATITRLARRLYAAHQQHFTDADPFAANSTFAQFAKSRRLVKGRIAPAKSTWRDFNPNDRRVNAVHTLLKLALRLLGPHKYELLMRYLAHITVLRNQSTFLRNPNWPTEK
jgi:hypothetical protein